jgi:hypothetical protein
MSYNKNIQITHREAPALKIAFSPDAQCNGSSRTTQNLSLPATLFGMNFSRFHELYQEWEKYF